ncbi:hypothetical protein [Thermomonospora amylolytica]|uniref:hypothetical protein n=1 Tax=Thermomonospora amylolytica TaxID=1411117 RepID=UPI00130056A8|nr:hypothetical protein [Thermomonospora amylolytica]
MKTIGLTAPFLAGILFYAISPLISQLIRRTIDDQLAQDADRSVPKYNPSAVPFFLSRPAIGDYIEYAIDVAQIIPGILLPLVSAIFAFSVGVNPIIPAFILIIGFIFGLAAMTWMLNSSASKYVSHKYKGGYSIATILTTVANLLAIIAIITLT